MNDLEYKKIFAAHRHDIPDDGFSKRVVDRLPERRNLLPLVVMVTFISIGFALMFAILGFDFIPEQINNLVASIDRQQIPPASSVITCIGITALTGLAGYSVAQVS